MGPEMLDHRCWIIRPEERDMRWRVSVGLLIFAASVAAFIGFAAGPAHANGGASSFSITIGSPHFSHWDSPRRFRKHWRPHNKHRHRHHGHFRPNYWPSPWQRPPRIVVVEPPREIAPPSSLRPAPYCREFQKQIIIDGKVERGYGVACRQPDGSWKIQP
jgi:hypothetical protein